MTDIIINSFEELHQAIQRYSTNTAIFRGVKNLNYELKPYIGRLTFTTSDHQKEEMILFTKFKQRAIPLDIKPNDGCIFCS